jgi:outer membrane protein TolC
MSFNVLIASAGLLAFGPGLAFAAEQPPARSDASTNVPSWMSQPLSLADALNVALEHNGDILKGKADLEAAYGIVVRTRAIALPKVQLAGTYKYDEAIEKFPFTASIGGGPTPTFGPSEHSWAGNVRLLQSIYEGGRITSSLRAARLTKEQALLQYQTVVTEAALNVRVAYYDILLGEQQIIVQQASLDLLQKELQDTTHRFEAGTVPQFNVLRAEVEVANARPRLIHARNFYRISKDNLIHLLGYHLPPALLQEIPLQLTGKLDAEPFDIELPAAVGQALRNRTELAALRKAEQLGRENVTSARAGYRPSVQVFTGYGGRNSTFTTDLTRDVSGWNAGVQVDWSIFDGLLTQGRIQEAKARHERTRVDVDDTSRRIELEVRTAHSNFIEAKEVLESQKKVQEQAEEALRLATSRYGAGTGTQLDVLNAQTALTEARTTQVQALHDYNVARARLERAIGQTIEQERK